MVLIAVLGLLSLLMFVTLQFAADTTFTTQYYTTMRDGEKAYYMATSIAGSALMLIKFDQGSSDSLKSLWAQRFPVMKVDEGLVELSIEDEERKFNPNAMVDAAGKMDDKHFKQFRLLLKLLRANDDFAGAVLDWIDVDDTRTLPGGAELSDYAEHPCKNAPLDSVEEVLLVKGCAKEDYMGKIGGRDYLPGLKEMLTAHSSGKININTANRFILMSLDSSITEEMANEVIRRRYDTPFKDLNGLLEVTGFNSDIIYRIGALADTKSEYFRMKVRASVGETTTYLTAIYKKDGSDFNPVYWKVD
ncbi:MAG: general secretion pathway protein GspK [bacterium]